MAATPQNVEMEAAKFLHQLIQQSTDEPTKLAIKLHVVLQHMRSSGKENSMPYQVISRAMETVINRRGLDIEALMSSRQPLTSGTQGGDASLSHIAGPSQQTPAVVESKKPLMSEDAAKIATFSSKPLQGPSSTGQDIYQGSANQLNSVKSHGSSAGLSGSYESAEPGSSRPMQFSSSYDNQNAANMMHKVPAGKALDHEGGFPNVIPNSSKAVQGGISSNVSEFGMLRNEASRDTGKLPALPSSAVGPSMPFKEHHLKQLRAQCLVFLAFRNNMMPKKLHLEIALGNVFPKEDISNKEQNDQKGSMGPGSSSSGFFSEANLLKEGEKLDPSHGLLEHGDGVRNNVIPRKIEAEMQASEAKEPQTSATKIAHPDTANTAVHPGLFAMPDIHRSRNAQAHLPSFPLSERQMVVPKNPNVLENNVTHGENHQFEP